jgi:RimJ/RimL family protein N-acetyltransferase
MLGAVIPTVAFELTEGPIVLRPWQHDDLEEAWAALQDPGIRLWNGTGSECREDAARMLRGRQDWTAGDHASWAVVAPVEGALLGSVSLHSVDAEQGSAEIGYWTTPGARGQGVAARAVDIACRWAYDAVPLHRITIIHALENAASARVAEKAGFLLEGRMRSSYRYGDGCRHDELLWSRLRTDPSPQFSS